MDETLLARYIDMKEPDLAAVQKIRAEPALLRGLMDHYASHDIGAAARWILVVMKGDDNMASVEAMLKKDNSSRGVCGKTLTKRSMAFKCLSCGSDPTCILCADCFHQSPCRNHNYRMVHSGGGICDCGDPTAWKPESFCNAHRQDNSIPPSEVIRRLPQDFVAWVTEALRATLRVLMLCIRHTVEGTEDDTPVELGEAMVQHLTAFVRFSDAARALVSTAFGSAAADHTTVALPGAFNPRQGNSTGYHPSDTPDTTASSDEEDDDEEDDEEGSSTDTAESLPAETPADQIGPLPVPQDGQPSLTILGQLFILSAAAQGGTRGARQVLLSVEKLCECVCMDPLFREAYVRAYTDTAWHCQKWELSLRAKKAGHKGATVKGPLEILAVQVLTVSPLVEKALLPTVEGGPTVLSAILGSQLGALAARARCVETLDGHTLYVEKGKLHRRTTTLVSLLHLRYVMYSRLSPRVLLYHRHLARAWMLLLVARQCSDYRIERSINHADLDMDLWDIDAADVAPIWAIHDAIFEACKVRVCRKDSSWRDCLGLAAEFDRPLLEGCLGSSIAPPSADPLLRTAATFEPFAPNVPSQTSSALQSALIPTIGAFFADAGDLLTRAASAGRLGAASQRIGDTSVWNLGASRRRVAMNRFDILSTGMPFTFHLSLSRFTALQMKAVLDAAAVVEYASLAKADDNCLLRSLVCDCLLGASRRHDPEITPSYIIDASLAPFLCLAQYVEQRWRTDYRGVHRHVNVYYGFLNAYNKELDLYMLQLMTAALGATYVSAHILSRFAWGAAGDDTVAAQAGHWHFLRLCLSIATDTSKTTTSDGLECRIVHALARSPLKRSEIDRLAVPYEMDDDQKQLAMEGRIGKILEDVARTIKKTDGNVYQLTLDAWQKVQPYHGGWTPYDTDEASENFKIQNRSHASDASLPLYPVVAPPSQHNPLLARVVEILQTPVVLVVAVSTLLLRATDLFSEAWGGAPPPVPHVITAIDTLSMALSTAKQVAGTAHSPRWRDDFVAAMRRLRASGGYRDVCLANAPSVIQRQLPLQLDVTSEACQSWDCNIGIHNIGAVDIVAAVINTTRYPLRKKMSVNAMLVHLLDGAGSFLSDVPPHHCTALRLLLRELSSAVDSAATEELDPAFDDAASAQRSQTQEQASRRERQAALLAKLRQQQNVATQHQLEATDEGAPASRSTPSTTNCLTLDDCIVAFENVENRCALCSETTTPDNPLWYLCHRATSDVLQQLQPVEHNAVDPSQWLLVTGHINFCGHMVHPRCFDRYRQHGTDVRSRRAEGLYATLAQLAQINFRGQGYLHDCEVLCPLCSRTVSMLCPPTAKVGTGALDDRDDHFLRDVAASVMRTAIDASQWNAADVEPHLKRLRDESAVREGVAVGEVNPTISQHSVLAWGALRAVSQQSCVLGIQSSIGTAPTLRIFAAFASLVKVLLRLLVSLHPEDLLAVARLTLAHREYHTLAAAKILEAALGRRRQKATSEPRTSAVAALLQQFPSLSVNTNPALLLARQGEIRALVLLRMAIHATPLPSQHTLLARVTNEDDIAATIHFRELQHPKDSDATRDISTITSLLRFALGQELTEESPQRPPTPIGPRVAAAFSQLPQSPSQRLTRHLTRCFADQQGAPQRCSVCDKKSPSLAKCLGCGKLMCMPGDPPELAEHARLCGSGTQLYIELSTTCLIAVQSYNQRWCRLPSPYVDQYGEADVGLRRGLPLNLDSDRLHELCLTWVACAWDHLTPVLHNSSWLLKQKPV